MADEQTTNVSPPVPVTEPAVRKGTLSETFSGLRVSLVPKDLLGQDGPDLKTRLMIGAMILILETGLIMVGYFLISQRLESKQKEKVSLEQQLEAVGLEAKQREAEMKEAMQFNTQMKATVSSLNSHVYLTELYAFLEANTLGGVKLNRVFADLKTGLVSLDLTAPRYRNMAEQLTYLKSVGQILEMRNTSVSGSMGDEGQLDYVSASLILKVNPSVWVGHPAMKKLSSN